MFEWRDVLIRGLDREMCLNGEMSCFYRELFGQIREVFQYEV